MTKRTLQIFGSVLSGRICPVNENAAGQRKDEEFTALAEMGFSRRSFRTQNMS
jgi:hypothetical protein